MLRNQMELSFDEVSLRLDKFHFMDAAECWRLVALRTCRVECCAE